MTAALLCAGLHSIPAMADDADPAELHWRMVTHQADWEARQLHGAAVFQDKMWVLGGMLCERSCEYGFCNIIAIYGVADVWCSSDGATWTEVASAAPWEARAGHAVLAFKDRLWVLGGTIYDAPCDVPCNFEQLTISNDVWYTEDGEHWVEASSAAPWAPRTSFNAVVYDDRMWVIGGLGGQNQFFNDVWYSEDGLAWTRATADAPWSARHSHASVAFDEGMWVIGGNDGSDTCCADVWYSQDGSNWVRVVESAPWGPRRQDHTVVTYAGNLWLFAGAINHTLMWDGWYSDDGQNWIQGNGLSAEARRGHATLVYHDRLWTFGGYSTDLYRRFVADCMVSFWGPIHTADRNLDGRLSLSELLRIIQLFQVGAYHCSLFGEDGYDIGPGPPYPWDEPEVCVPHDSDYNPQDWRIDLSELLRAVQFFNAGGYHACPDAGTEDGNCPG